MEEMEEGAQVTWTTPEGAAGQTRTGRFCVELED